MSNKTAKFNHRTLIDFDKILINDSSEINRLQESFESHGWCFVRLPDENGQLGNNLNQVQTILTKFFSQDQTKKSKLTSSNSLGYSRVGHKEGIKVLIDQHGLQNYHVPLTNDVEQVLQYLAVLLYKLSNILKSIIFQMPAFRQSLSTETVPPLSSLGMLDIVHYFNERTGPVEEPKVGRNTNEVNCVPHFDPGLFSLSILSTCDGLQLNDRLKDKWINGPNNSIDEQRYIGVIWLGEAASILTQNRFKSGIHRVVYPRIPNQPRLTIWQEVCTQAQIDGLLHQDNHPTLMPDNVAIKLSNQPNSKPMRIKSGGENLKSVLNRVEYERGLSPSKLARHHVTNIHQRPTIQQPNSNFLFPGSSVTMINQPNSEPMEVQSAGETMRDFMKRVENERGLSMSKSGIHHFDVKVPIKKSQKQDQPSKKRSFISNIFH